MRRVSLIAAALLSLTLAPQAGGQGADVLLNCAACHAVGPDRNAGDVARAPSPYPNLNGQSVRYLDRQLWAYREGLRQHPQMQATATALGDGAGAMARMYADAPAPELTFTASPGAFADAETLVMEGDWSRGLPSCASCHALDPDDRARLSPRLHGHPAPYIARQLRAYADGTRRSDPMGRMRAYAAELTEDEMSQLADYYAAWGPETDQTQEDDTDG
ncbi:c-type cytochrome [Tateyamaria omphalii]|uniref:Cytochrome c domain-containing protein n=1 Tax=Tateyamaria omphalii TaxID=299262 RepID=A0A1P8MRF9_9RHOB|nr:c-type cytochrome [Tateyamaria omphalii]APX10573.1 hypothetical protein BWR18_01815 [Tateyamaria omphalii]